MHLGLFNRSTTHVDGGGVVSYPGLDRLGRVVEQRWADDADSTVDGFDYGYDTAGNRTYRVHSVSNDHDELYGYDGLHRLGGMKRGTLNANKDDIPVNNRDFAEDWTLDKLGNWKVFKRDDDGDDTPELDQDRMHNAVNEIMSITGGGWVVPDHDKAGNMTVGPKPGEETTEHRYTYDAWNRLRWVHDDQDNVVAFYEYNGLHHRVIEFTMADGNNRYFYYNPQWQVLEERTALSNNEPEVQYVWDQRYIDAPVLRDRDPDRNGGALDKRHYYTNDANMNLTALIQPDGSEAERMTYTAYGLPTFHDADFTSTTSSSTVDNHLLFAGYRHDPATGLYHVRNRIYDAATGRWGQRDPAGYVDGMSSYEYVKTRPTGLADPSGLRAIPHSAQLVKYLNMKKTIAHWSAKVSLKLSWVGRVTESDDGKEWRIVGDTINITKTSTLQRRRFTGLVGWADEGMSTVALLDPIKARRAEYDDDGDCAVECWFYHGVLNAVVEKNIGGIFADIDEFKFTGPIGFEINFDTGMANIVVTNDGTTVDVSLNSKDAVKADFLFTVCANGALRSDFKQFDPDTTSGIKKIEWADEREAID